MSRRIVSLALVATLASSACTLGMPVATSGVIWAHNGVVDHGDEKWSYGAAVAVSVAIGLVVDVLLFKALGDAWSRPMTFHPRPRRRSVDRDGIA